jgi:hypothetical protein
MTDDPRVAVLDSDEADVVLNPTRTRVWAPIGVPWKVEMPGDNRKQAVFAAVDSRTGQTHFALRPAERSGDFQAFVDQVVRPASPQADSLFQIVRGASIYHLKSTQAWLAQRPELVLVPLPSYAPKLNLEELI